MGKHEGKHRDKEHAATSVTLEAIEHVMSEVEGVSASASRQRHAMSTPHYAEGRQAAASRKAGEDARAAVPPRKLAAWHVEPGREAKVRLLTGQDEGRLPELVGLRHERMTADAFSFFRGAALLMADDLAGLPTSGLKVQACGDAHIANFGGYRSPESNLVFDLNDFDETCVAPWDWDVRRMVASIAVCGQSRGLDDDWCWQACFLAAESYRQGMRGFAQQGQQDVWRTYVDVARTLDALSGKVPKKVRRKAAAQLEKAFSKTSLKAFGKLVEVSDGQVHMVYDPPHIVPLEKFLTEANAQEVRQRMRHLQTAYLESLQDPYAHLMDDYSILGVALKVVGVGSVGLRCWVAVLAGDQVADPLVIQVKEANRSVLERYCGEASGCGKAERVVRGQRLMQTVADPLLGWADVDGMDGAKRSYYFRQLWNWKGSIDLAKADSETVELYGQLCGWTLARAHARSGDRVAIAAYLGESDEFDQAMADFALAYAQQNQQDFDLFKRLVG